MLTMSCNQPHFQALMGAVMDTWAKPLIHNKYPEITWFGYTACDSHHPKPMVDFENHMIYVDCDDDVFGTYDKTRKAYNLIKNSVDFDYVVRTNTSLFVNIDKMLDYINNADENSIIANRSIACENINGVNVFCFWLVVGFFIGMKREWFDIAVSDGDVARNSHDDVIMSYKLSKVLGNDINFTPINPDGNVVMYKPCKPEDTELSDKVKEYFTLEFENPRVINEQILVRLRTLYENEERLKYGHELEHFYELNTVLKTNYY